MLKYVYFTQNKENVKMSILRRWWKVILLRTDIAAEICTKQMVACLYDQL